MTFKFFLLFMSVLFIAQFYNCWSKKLIKKEKLCSLALFLLHIQHNITEYFISPNSLQSKSLQNFLLRTTACPDYWYILTTWPNAWTIWKLNLFFEKKTVLVWIPPVKHPEIQKSRCFPLRCKVYEVLF